MSGPGWVLLISTVIGLAVGGAMMYIAWQHNPQGEFHEASGVHWSHWLLLGGLWAALIAVPGALLAGIAKATMPRDLDPPGWKSPPGEPLAAPDAPRQ
jgi:hypothetical protein